MHFVFIALPVPICELVDIGSGVLDILRYTMALISIYKCNCPANHFYVSCCCDSSSACTT